MKGTEGRYLPIFKPDGRWIERPDLYLLARMAYPDQEDQGTASQLYQALCAADPAREVLNHFESTISKKEVAQNPRPRTLAGSVVLELARMVATPGVQPTLAAARRLVERGQMTFSNHRAQPMSVRRDVERGFSDYRNTSHLQAAAILMKPDISVIEGSESATVEFLSAARFLEGIVDQIAACDRTKWSPWRVPREVTAATALLLPPISPEELRFLGA